MIEMKPEGFIPVHTKAVFPGDETVRVCKVDKMQPDENTYLKVKELDFHNGVIEVDVCGKLLRDAPDYARGFIGIVFRANDSDSEFESFYIRPTNGRDCDDPVRKAHGCQYFSYPGYTFSYFREFGITRYEGAVVNGAISARKLKRRTAFSMWTGKRFSRSVTSNMVLTAAGALDCMWTSGRMDCSETCISCAGTEAGPTKSRRPCLRLRYSTVDSGTNPRIGRSSLSVSI